MVVAEFEVDTDASFGDVMEIQFGLRRYGSSLSISMLDHAYGTKGEEGLSRVRIEFWRLLHCGTWHRDQELERKYSGR